MLYKGGGRKGLKILKIASIILIIIVINPVFVKDLAAAVQTAKALSAKLTPAEVKAKLGEGILNSYLSPLKGTVTFMGK
jgi:hypothetical protein